MGFETKKKVLRPKVLEEIIAEGKEAAERDAAEQRELYGNAPGFGFSNDPPLQGAGHSSARTESTEPDFIAREEEKQEDMEDDVCILSPNSSRSPLC